MTWREWWCTYICQCSDLATIQPIIWTVGPITDQGKNDRRPVGKRTGRIPLKKESGQMALLLKVTQKCRLSVQFKDSKGNTAVVEGTPEWSTSDPGLLTVAAEPDGLSATITPGGSTGSAQVSIKADADLGAGVKEIAGTLDVTLLAGDASVVTISPDVPTDQ